MKREPYDAYRCFFNKPFIMDQSDYPDRKKAEREYPWRKKS